MLPRGNAPGPRPSVASPTPGERRGPVPGALRSPTRPGRWGPASGQSHRVGPVPEPHSKGGGPPRLGVGGFGGEACGPEVLTLPALRGLPLCPPGKCGARAVGLLLPPASAGATLGRLWALALRVPGATNDRLRPVQEKPGPRIKLPPHSLPKSSFLRRPRPGLSSGSPSLNTEGNGGTED